MPAAWLARRRWTPTDGFDPLLAAVRVLNRLGCARQALRLALNTLAEVAPNWLRAWVPAAWVERYDHHNDDPWQRLPTKALDQAAEAQTIGADGLALLNHLYAQERPAWLRELPAVQRLRRVWVEQFVPLQGELRLRTREDGWPAPVDSVCSLHDLDAHCGTKPPTTWLGYKIRCWDR